MPTVNVSVAVFGAEMRVFQDTSPPALGSEKLSGTVFLMSSALKTMAFSALLSAMTMA
jgi:hypothetical protein